MDRLTAGFPQVMDKDTFCARVPQLLRCLAFVAKIVAPFADDPAANNAAAGAAGGGAGAGAGAGADLAAVRIDGDHDWTFNSVATSSGLSLTQVKVPATTPCMVW